MTPLLDLNLASRPFRNNTLLWTGHAVALALLILITTMNVRTHADHRRELRELSDTVGSIEGQMRQLDQREQVARRGINTHDVDDLQVQATKANDVLQRKALSWTRLFNEIEEVLPIDVRMISIRPVFLKEVGRSSRQRVPEGAIPVNVQGASKSLEALLEFERNLLDDPRFDDVEPHRYSREGAEFFWDLKFLYFPAPEVAEPAEQEQQAPPAEQPAEDATPDGATEPDPAAPSVAEERAAGPARSPTTARLARRSLERRP